ncbi:hypothetical protein SmJEL517_g05687 [Synchytrium microbalum]|uniref:Chromatin modification-related protein EAF3 n=1 Tax=Synchytrium microbalum TaxID=1806994 RepID=A0A507BV45_9FUNG|nr:uncharacterized protein SmJEL517_g05687 [Synchytrium microbalum]TPX30839.1 hypothetical protein SmJEL517_g05687 [Synchytrium microbalum]
MTADMLFKEDESVLCFHGPMLYEAKVLTAEVWENRPDEEQNGPHYFVHYKGWKPKWDEWVPEERVLKTTEENMKRQADLKANVDGGKKGKGAAAKAPGADAEKKVAAQKRKLEEMAAKEEEFVKRPEIKIPIPDALKVQLVDDWENVTKNGKLVPLPRNPTITSLLESYRESIKTKKNAGRDLRADDIVTEVVEGIKHYFERSLGNVLLYRQERQQYQEQLRKNDSGKAMADIYGAEHLLRLFVQMPNLIAHTNMDQDAAEILKDHFVNILNFMARNQKELFLDYQTIFTAGEEAQAAGNAGAAADIEMKDA